MASSWLKSKKKKKRERASNTCKWNLSSACCVEWWGPDTVFYGCTSDAFVWNLCWFPEAHSNLAHHPVPSRSVTRVSDSVICKQAQHLFFCARKCPLMHIGIKQQLYFLPETYSSGSTNFVSCNNCLLYPSRMRPFPAVLQPQPSSTLKHGHLRLRPLSNTSVLCMYYTQVDVRDTFRNFSSLSSGHLCSEVNR